jgi:hypothetical protein
MVFLEPRIEHSTNEVGLLAVKEAVAHNTPADSVHITARLAGNRRQESRLSLNANTHSEMPAKGLGHPGKHF